MGTNDRLALAIRTIAVTTRAAILSNEKIGRPDLAVDSARLGLAMLDELAASLPIGTDPGLREEVERVRRELLKSAEEPGSAALTTGADEAPAPSTSGGGSSSGSG